MPEPAKGSAAADKNAPKQGERVNGERPQGKCSIAGKVISEATGKPIADASMMLWYSPTFSSIFVHTASDGTFVFKDIRKGPYVLETGVIPGYQEQYYDPEGKNDELPEFTLKDRENRSGIVLKLKEACRVSGKVADENGNVPADVKDLGVMAWFKRDDRKGYGLLTGNVKSDGSYVVDGLSGKPVYVMAIDLESEKSDHPYPPIYYPSTFFRSEAKLITFDKGRSVEGINITWRKQGGLIVAGTVRDEAGKPIPKALVVIHHRDMLVDDATAYTDQQGRYELEGLGDGEFVMHVDAMYRGFVWTRALILLDGRTQRTERDSTLTRGVSISGKFADQEGNAWEIARGSGGHAALKTEEPQEYSVSGGRNKYGPHDVKEHSGSLARIEGPYYYDGMLFPTKSSFLIQGVKPGHTIIEFSPKKEGQEVVAIRYNDRDIRESGVDTKRGQEIKDVTIVVAPRPGGTP